MRASIVHPPGDPKTLWRATRQTGAQFIQDRDPLKGSTSMTGFDCAGHKTDMLEARHFCKQVDSDFLQCAVFDGNAEDANLIGIEYITSFAPGWQACGRACLSGLGERRR